jgi:hypothetical protein
MVAASWLVSAREAMWRVEWRIDEGQCALGVDCSASPPVVSSVMTPRPVLEIASADAEVGVAGEVEVVMT